MSTINMVVGSVLWLGVLLAVGRSVLFSDAQTETDAAAGASTDAAAKPGGDAVTLSPQDSSVKIGFPARELPAFEFPECMGGTISRDSLKGQPWVASFVFTRCATTCPMITKEVMELHRRVADSSPDVKFVTFSVDSSYDTAEVLQKYAEIYSADHARWKFVTGDEQAIHDLIRQGFTLYVKPNLGNERKPGFEVAHSNRVVLVNADSIPVATFLATRPEDMVKLRRILEGKDPFPEPGPAASLTITNPNADGTAEAQPAVNLEVRKVDEAAPTASEAAGIAPAAKSDAAAADASGVGPQSLAEPAASGSEKAEDAAAVAGSSNARIDQLLPAWVRRLPTANALLNGCSTVLLIGGFVAIRSGQRQLHRRLMITAFLVSVAFLASYLIYHSALQKYTGEQGRRFEGSAAATLVYRSILLPHVVLAVFVPVLAIRVFQHALKERWTQHRRLAKITLPIWLFVSVTGVIIYWMLYHWPWPASGAAVS